MKALIYRKTDHKVLEEIKDALSFKRNQVEGAKRTVQIDTALADYVIVDDSFEYEDYIDIENIIDKRSLLPETPDQKITRHDQENITVMLALTDLYEEKERQNAQREQENIDTMLAITELYEMMMGGTA